jgi:hypothetical protein
MRWCRKQATCKWCDKPIEIGTPLVAVFFWNKGNENSRRWNVTLYYHPQCWVDQGLDYLERNPFVPHRRGRVRTLSNEDARKRFLLVRRFHALEQRKRNIKAPYPDNLLVEERLTKQMVDVMLDVANLGGAPKSWSEKL